MIVHHALDIEVLDSDDAVIAGNLSAQLMMPVRSLIRYFLLNTGDLTLLLSSILAPFLLSSEFALLFD